MTRFWVVLSCWAANPAFAQIPVTAQDVREIPKILEVRRTSCPGDEPGALGSYDCNFTMKARTEQFVSSSLTDQALLGATFFGTVAQIRHDPEEWKQDWGGFGYRVGSRYAQNLTKGLTQFTFGMILKTDPRHLSYINDPGRIPDRDCAKDQPTSTGQDRAPKVGPRIGHAFLDWATARQSSLCGGGRRLPNIPMFAGAAASGFIGNLWYPDRLATPGEAGLRELLTRHCAIRQFLYRVSACEVGRLLGAILKRGKTPKTPASGGAAGGGQ